MDMTAENTTKIAAAAAGTHSVEPNAGSTRAQVADALRPLTPLLASAAFFVTMMGLVGSLLVA
jgi:hypothetical protein